MTERLRRLRELLDTVRREGRLPVGRWWRLLIKIAVVTPAVLLPLVFAFVMASNQPRFCIQCHYMKPFYDAWKTSSHHNVKCVDCHIPPGAKNWLAHKGAAAVQVVKYVTRQYGTRPWVEIDDASCLRAGCHETRLLAGKVKFGGVTFDHGPHLSSFRRVTRLRCTSCHAQIVQGTHMAVTESTCFLCHFKNSAEAPKMAECRRCHQEIKPHRPGDTGGERWAKPGAPAAEQKPSFDHKLVLERSVDCRYCHNNVVHGQGEVPKDRCLLCHTDPSRMLRYNDTEFIHSNHVTKHKVDCQRCHQEIQHKLPEKDSTPKLDCASCHPGQHQDTRTLYQGHGGTGAVGKGNPMFDARVPCEGCHLGHQPVNGHSVTSKGGAAGCMLCHGERYGQALSKWQNDAVAWTRWAEESLARTEQEVARLRPGQVAPAGLQTARKNVKLVVAGRFIHNPDYSAALLQVAAKEAGAALAELGSAYRWPPPPARSSVPQPQATCASCHTGVTNKGGMVFGVRFEHKVHVGQAALPCATCHTDNAQPQSAGHGRLTIGRDDCQACHDKRKLKSPHPADWKLAHPGAARSDRASCTTCHAQSFCDNCHGTPIPHAANWVRVHGQTVKNERRCQLCHRTSFCSGCHKAAMPPDHHNDWRRRHGRAAQADRQRCARCHSESKCNNCHGTPMPHGGAWTGLHGATAARNPALCAKCHQSSSCRSCHAKQPPRDHKRSDWRAMHGQRGERSSPFCSMCHGRDACSSCHGVKMPHPDNWTVKGHGPVAQRRRAVCAKCHKQEYCSQCHVKTPEGGR